ncbi:MAG: hypothetical protein H6765_11345 [Candidatus Peribacteria bacterium]|nr:MAG: hypothetical protein H6765_11345 [Candidatus Peribacteria bacterium]
MVGLYNFDYSKPQQVIAQVDTKVAYANMGTTDVEAGFVRNHPKPNMENIYGAKDFNYVFFVDPVNKQDSTSYFTLDDR